MIKLQLAKTTKFKDLDTGATFTYKDYHYMKVNLLCKAVRLTSGILYEIGLDYVVHECDFEFIATI